MPRQRAVSAVVARRGGLVVERDRRRPSGRLLRQGGMEASYVDLADERHLEFDYLRWIRIVLRAAGARRVLHIGGGACVLARALAAEDPSGRQLVCESDADVLAVAREHLGLRPVPGLRVRLAEGRAFLSAQGDSAHEAIVIDAFVGAAVAAGLTTAEAAQDARRVAPLTLINVVDSRTGREVGAIATALGDAYPHVWALGGRAGNTVLAGCARALDLARIAAAAAADPSPSQLIGPDALARRVAGAVARHD